MLTTADLRHTVFFVALLACRGSDLQGPSLGGIQVTVTTIGSAEDLDPDGYMVAVDGGAGQALPINGTVTFTQVTAGEHSVDLSGNASNCTVSGQNPTTVTVTAGTTARTDFQIVCAVVAGSTGRIAFVSTRDGNPEIYVMNADGTGITRLTKSAGSDVSPAWSRDGTRIAFMSDRDSGNKDIYVMNADGTGVKRLTNDPAFDGEPAWSPGGTRIAFQSNRAGHFEIYVMKASGSGVTRLTSDLSTECLRVPPPCHAESPAWSPDGARIAFVHQGNNFARDLDVMRADGSDVRRVTGDAVGDITWSVLDKIAFVRSGAVPAIAVVNADGTNLTPLTGTQASGWDPAWSPDGSMLCFVSDRDENLELYIMNADGSGVRRLTYDSAGDTEPAWAP